MTATKLKVRVAGDPVLRKKSKPVKEVGAAERILIDQMIETMHQEQGVGLAAPQVGIHQQILVIDVEGNSFVVINPRVIKKRGSEVVEEGCLSVPGIVVKIRRPKYITLRYLDENGQKKENEFADLTARVTLHEMDHLNGKLIIDYASWFAKRKFKKQLEELKNKVKST